MKHSDSYYQYEKHSHDIIRRTLLTMGNGVRWDKGEVAPPICGRGGVIKNGMSGEVTPQR